MQNRFHLQSCWGLGTLWSSDPDSLNTPDPSLSWKVLNTTEIYRHSPCGAFEELSSCGWHACHFFGKGSVKGCEPCPLLEGLKILSVSTALLLWSPALFPSSSLHCQAVCCCNAWNDWHQEHHLELCTERSPRTSRSASLWIWRRRDDKH